MKAHDPERVPVHVLTGFLGSGKTTWLNHLLQDAALIDTAVIINEFGSVGLDHFLVESSSEELIELSGGCVCCSIRGDLATTLEMLLAKRDAGAIPAFQRVVIETTGLADPTPVFNLLLTDEVLGQRLRPGQLTATVDAINGEQTLAAYPEATRQVLLATAIVVTKTDLQVSAQIPSTLAQTLRQLNPHAIICTPDEAALNALVSDNGADALDVGQLSQQSTHQHSPTIESFVVSATTLPAAVLPLLVTTLAEQLGPKLLRVKGLVALTEMPGRPVILHGAQHVFHQLQQMSSWPSGCPEQTRIVFIVDGDARAFVEALLDALRVEVEAVVELRHERGQQRV